MEKATKFIQDTAAKVGLSEETTNYVIRLVTSPIMLGSIITIIAASLIFSPFLPFYWVALAGGLGGVVVAVHRTDQKIAEEKSQSGSGAAPATASGDGLPGLDVGKISLFNIISSLFPS